MSREKTITGGSADGLKGSAHQGDKLSTPRVSEVSPPFVCPDDVCSLAMYLIDSKISLAPFKLCNIQGFIILMRRITTSLYDVEMCVAVEGECQEWQGSG